MNIQVRYSKLFEHLFCRTPLMVASAFCRSTRTATPSECNATFKEPLGFLPSPHGTLKSKRNLFQRGFY